MTLTDVLIGLVIAIGLVGVLLPILPGTLLIAVALLVWAILTGGTAAWVCFGVAAAILVAGAVVKYLIPGKQLTAAVPTKSLLIGGLLGVIGFFAIPIVGLFLGFVLGVYLAEYQRVGQEAAWPSTKAALKAIGLSILIELLAGVLAAGVWFGGVLAT